MNKTQRTILFLGAAIIFFMLLFPPFHLWAQLGVRNLGYSFLFDPPRINGYVATVNTGMLLVQWVAVLLIGGILWFALRNKQ